MGRMLFLSKHKKSSSQAAVKGNRLLITINVLGSAGPLRFVVYEGELVAEVINMALKAYTREGRRPVLDSNLNQFLLYCPADGSDALRPWETIGAHGTRNFMLCKKPQSAKEEGEEAPQAAISNAKKGSGSWKSWINKSFSYKVASH